MDITPHISDLAASRDQVHNLMAETTTVACFGSRALLSLFVCAAPVPQSVVAAVTTEAEGLDRVKQHRPVFLFATEQLESGNGLSLVRHFAPWREEGSTPIASAWRRYAPPVAAKGQSP